MVMKGAGPTLRIENKPYPNKPRIQINGRSVTPHGIVFLNDEKESLSFRAIAASGAEFKMDTRSVNLEFVDVVNLNENLMSITIKGPFPLAPSNYKIIKDNLWSVALKKSRALIYISGAGKVPLRQEFIVQGPLPSEENRLYLEKSSPTHAYASSLELRGWSPAKGSPQAADTSSDVIITGDRFTWSLSNLTVGQDKMANVQVVDGRDVFTAGYSFSRVHANRVEFLGGIDSFKNNLFFGTEAQMWLESIPYLTYSSQQHVGLGLIYKQDLTGDSKTILTELDAYWRVKKGLQFLDKSWVAGFAVQNWSFDGKSLQTLGLMGGWMGKPFDKLKFLKNYFDWQEISAKYSLPGKVDAIELNSRIEAKWKLYHSLKDNRKIRYSASLYTEDSTQKRSGLSVEAAWVMIF
jgi:hypothetical protein